MRWLLPFEPSWTIGGGLYYGQIGQNVSHGRARPVPDPSPVRDPVRHRAGGAGRRSPAVGTGPPRGGSAGRSRHFRWKVRPVRPDPEPVSAREKGEVLAHAARDEAVGQDVGSVHEGVEAGQPEGSEVREEDVARA